jgi:aryl-alcohol dehydrogenase-like predicted oxidoreductase
MKYRRLGMWGVQLSEVGLGSWLILNKRDQSHADALHRTAYENGINFYDTANVYGRGQAEIMVGKALKPFRRDSFVLATKVFWPFEADWPFPGANDRGLSRKHLFEQCHASLKRLGVDYIDLYQCHRFDPNTPVIETCHAMNDLIRQGKILYWGVSEWNAEQITDAVAICNDHNWHRPVSHQPLYNMLERHWEELVLPTCKRLGMGVANFSPLAEGLLTGKYLQGIPKDSRAADEAAGQFIKPRMTPENLDIVRRLDKLAHGMGVPVATLAIAWCLRRPEITSTIIGASKPQQIIDNARASELVLDDEVLERISVILGG